MSCSAVGAVLTASFIVLPLTVSSVPLPSHHRRQTRSQNTDSGSIDPMIPTNFCSREDHLIFAVESDTSSPTQLNILSTQRGSDQLQVMTYNTSSRRGRKVSRHQLFHFEVYKPDLTNSQWTVMASDGRHMAVSETGGLVVKSGCVSTTFLRIVDESHLEECYNGSHCVMSLCATALSNSRNSFILAPANHNYSVSVKREQCKNHAAFRALKQAREGQATTINWHRLTILAATRNQHMLSKGLKLLCPEQFERKKTIEYTCTAQPATTSSVSAG